MGLTPYIGACDVDSHTITDPHSNPYSNAYSNADPRSYSYSHAQPLHLL